MKNNEVAIGSGRESKVTAGKVPPITLYTFTMSPYAEKVHCYLQYKRLPFQCFYINPLRLKKDLPIGTQVPALTIGDKSKTDSSAIGLWLDDVFPDHARLLPEDPEQQKAILAIDQWVTHRLITSNFRNYPGVGVTPRRVLNGWRLGQVLHKTSHGGVPLVLQAMWPLVLSQLGFLKDMVAMADTHVPLKSANCKIREEFLAHLGEGPFLGGMDRPSLADLSAYPQFVAPYVAGLRGAEEVLEYPEIVSWMHRVRGYLMDTPPLIPPVAVKREFPGDPVGGLSMGQAM